MDGGHSSTLSPHVATPRAELKRKHGEVIDLTEDDDGGTSSKRPTPAPADVDCSGVLQHAKDHRRRLEDDDVGDDSDTESFWGDALDTIELEPYMPKEGEVCLSEDKAVGLHAELRKIGPDDFICRYVTSGKIPPELLGTAFGMNPYMDIDVDTFKRILRLAIQRAYNKRQKLAAYNTIDDAASLLRTSRNIMVITGAGISTSLGIPDFRSQGTGFYDKVRAMGYEGGEDVFDIHNFDEKPEIFYSLAGDIVPDLKRFSPTHAFIKLLQDEGRLQTNYTQNIDNLEARAGVDPRRLIQCHGSFATASCRKCKHQVPGHEIFADIRAKRVAYCRPCREDIAKMPKAKAKTKPKAFKLKKNDWESSSEDESDYDIPQPGVMKPDITFFGEKLADRFFDRFTERDSKNVDLVIVIGTSLKVAPVSEMPNYLPPEVPHIFISREPIEHVNFDIQLLGDCDHVVYELCRRAGWRLGHEMIPQGFKVRVAPVEGSTYRWTVTPVKAVEEKKPMITAFSTLTQSIATSDPHR